MKILNTLLVVVVAGTALILMPVAIVVVAFGVAKDWLDNKLISVVLK